MKQSRLLRSPYYPRNLRGGRFPHLNTDLPGWHQREHPGLRWTNGSATLPLGYREPTGNGVLCIQIVNAGPYLLDTDETAAQALSA